MRAEKNAQAKLPKLVITKFNGTYQDSPRFWEQFKETVDKILVEPVIELTYLRELLETKARKAIYHSPVRGATELKVFWKKDLEKIQR